MHEFCYAILDSLFKLVQRSFSPVICQRDEGCHVWLFCVEIDIIPNQSIHQSINLTNNYRRRPLFGRHFWQFVLPLGYPLHWNFDLQFFLDIGGTYNCSSCLSGGHGSDIINNSDAKTVSFRTNGEIAQLLMPWLHASQGRRQSWHWPCRIHWPLSTIWKDFNDPHRAVDISRQ